MGCKTCEQCAGSTNMIILCWRAHSVKPAEVCDLCPSRIGKTRSSVRPGKYVRKCSIHQRNIVELDHPDSLTVPPVPGDAPHSRSGSMRFLGKTKQQRLWGNSTGTTQPSIVIVLLFSWYNSKWISSNINNVGCFVVHWNPLLIHIINEIRFIKEIMFLRDFFKFEK